MRSLFLFSAFAISLPFFSAIAAAETYYGSWTVTQPAISTWRPVSPARSVVSTPAIVEHPMIVSESAPIRLSRPMNQVVSDYDVPVSTTISTGSSTRVSMPATETIISERIIAPDTETPKPLISMGDDLKPLLPKRLPPPEPSEETAAADPAPIDLKSLPESKDEIVTLPETETPPVRELVSTERVENTENIFKDIMIPRELPVRATVAKPPRRLPPTESSIPTPPAPLGLPEPVAKTEVRPEPPPEPLILGQYGTRNQVEDIMSSNPPFPEGPVDPSDLDPKLVDTGTVPPPLDVTDPSFGPKDKTPLKPTPNQAKREQWVSGALLLTTIIASMVACYAVVLAFEFRQRWLQSVTEQNNRYAMPFADLSGGYPDDLNIYGGGSLYGGLLEETGRYGTEIMEPSMRF